MDNPFAKRLMKDDRAEIFHSSAYGRAQSGGAMGAASTESFEERKKIDESRKTIRKYDDSMVAEQRYNKEAQGSTRLDQPKQNDEITPTFYEDMLNAAKTNSGIDVNKEAQRTQTASSAATASSSREAQRTQTASAAANSSKDAAVARAERTARQLMGQGKISQKEMEQQIAKAQARANHGSRRGAPVGETADLHTMAQQRAERSARFADKRAMGGATGGARPQAPRPMPKISSRPPRAF